MNMNKNEKKIVKYMTLYMSIGMCFGVSGGLIYGNILFPDNVSYGLSFGIPIGMLVGMAIGSIKDKKLSLKMMKIIKIEKIADSKDFSVFTKDKDGVEKKYIVSEKNLKCKKFVVGDRVAQESNNNLVSLESK